MIKLSVYFREYAPFSSSEDYSLENQTFKMDISGNSKSMVPLNKKGFSLGRFATLRNNFLVLRTINLLFPEIPILQLYNTVSNLKNKEHH